MNYFLTENLPGFILGVIGGGGIIGVLILLRDR